MRSTAEVEDAVIVQPSGWARRVWHRLKDRVVQRWPVIRRQLPRDLAILALVGALATHMSLAWVMTDSVHSTVVLILKGGTPAPGELAVFGYTGQSIDGYYPVNSWTRLKQALGMTVSSVGPQRGDGFVKYLMGVPGDRIELQGRQVVLVKSDGRRLDLGRCKTHSKTGVALTPIAPQVIPPGYVYMWAPHVDALDSRYALMGLVPATAIVGKAVALW